MIVDFADENIVGSYQIAPNIVHIELTDQRIPLSLVKHMRINEYAKKDKIKERGDQNKILRSILRHSHNFSNNNYRSIIYEDDEK